MHQHEGASIKTGTTANDDNSKNCCGKCAGRNNTQYAHCGKSYIIKDGILEEIEIDTPSIIEEFDKKVK